MIETMPLKDWYYMIEAFRSENGLAGVDIVERGNGDTP